MKKEKLSVIVPVYNVEKYLEKCLNSIINQTYKNLEIICIDDGSPDNSIKILEKYQLKDKRIRIIRQENKGLGATRNIGINMATGTYISFIDSDDWIELDMFEKCIEVFKKYNVDLVDCSTYYDSTINSQKVRDLRKLNYKNDYNGEEYFKLLVRNNLFSASSCNKIFRLENLKKNKIFFPENRLYEDFLFTLKMILVSKKIGIVTLPMYHYLINREASITNVLNKKDLEDMIYTVESLKNYLNRYEDVLKSKEFKEYIFLWISRAILCKVINFYPQDKEKVFKILKELCSNKYFKKYSKDIFFNLSINIKYKILIFLLYFYKRLCLKLLKMKFK